MWKLLFKFRGICVRVGLYWLYYEYGIIFKIKIYRFVKYDIIVGYGFCWGGGGGIYRFMFIKWMWIYYWKIKMVLFNNGYLVGKLCLV